MDVSDIRTPLLIDSIRFKITPPDIFLVIRDTAVVGMMIVLLYYDGAQSLPCPLKRCKAGTRSNRLSYSG